MSYTEIVIKGIHLKTLVAIIGTFSPLRYILITGEQPVYANLNEISPQNNDSDRTPTSRDPPGEANGAGPKVTHIICHIRCIKI